MSGFDRLFRMNVLSWGTRLGSRLSGCPEPMRRMAPYVIGKLFDSQVGGLFHFDFAITGVDSGAEVLDVTRKNRRAGVARRSELAVVVRVANSAQSGAGVMAG
jgi:hypothetical protein